MKTAISIRLDPEIIAFFRIWHAEGYQKGISKVLAEFVRAETARMEFIRGRAQEIFLKYHSQCFWHLRQDLEITHELLPMVRERLRKYGGRTGFQLAMELETTRNKASESCL